MSIPLPDTTIPLPITMIVPAPSTPCVPLPGDAILDVDNISIGKPIIIRSKAGNSYSVDISECQIDWASLLRNMEKNLVTRFYKKDGKFHHFVYSSDDNPKSELERVLYKQLPYRFIQECYAAVSDCELDSYNCFYVAFTGNKFISSTNTSFGEKISACIIMNGANPENIYIVVSDFSMGVHQTMASSMECSVKTMLHGNPDVVESMSCILNRDINQKYLHIDLDKFENKGDKLISEVR